LPDITVTKTGVWVIKIRNWSEGSHFWLNFDRITCFHTKERPLLPRAQDTAPNPLLHVFFWGMGERVEAILDTFIIIQSHSMPFTIPNPMFTINLVGGLEHFSI
jgi:hypothetical protein